MIALLAAACLLLLVPTLMLIGGALFAPFLLGLFVLALAGVLSGLDDHTVRRRNPRLDGAAWRNGGP